MLILVELIRGSITCYVPTWFSTCYKACISAADVAEIQAFQIFILNRSETKLLEVKIL